MAEIGEIVQCRKCGESKPRDWFRRQSKKLGGKYTQPCLDCRRQQHREHYMANRDTIRPKHRAYAAKHRDKMRAYSRRYHAENYAAPQKHGLTLDEFHAILERQGDRCAICGDSPLKYHIDHDHRTNRVRGLLCNRCNLGIGLMRDNADALLKAAAYVRKGAVTP